MTQVNVRQVLSTALFSVDDDVAAQSFTDYDLVCDAVKIASKIHLNIDNPFANAFPGDHYRLLAGLFTILNARSPIKQIVDIGTHMGTGTRVMLDYSPSAAVSTFDVTAWDKFDPTFLRSTDFKENGGRLVQYLDDLKEPRVFQMYSSLLNEADFIMCDGPKDNVFEEEFLQQLSDLELSQKPRWLFLDDIRFLDEMPRWRRILSPKIDLVSFGHFSGSGLVDISRGLKFA